MTIFKWVGAFFLLLWAVLSFLSSPLTDESGMLFLGAYTFLKLVGLTMGAMLLWCDAEKITHTPTIFINGHELPKEYSVEDLKEILG